MAFKARDGGRAAVVGQEGIVSWRGRGRGTKGRASGRDRKIICCMPPEILVMASPLRVGRSFSFDIEPEKFGPEDKFSLLNWGLVEFRIESKRCALQDVF